MHGRLEESKPFKSHANREKIENRGINGIRGKPFLFRIPRFPKNILAEDLGSL
jgi:hypothetical protein